MSRPDLVADCASCAALCCVAPSFDAGEDFAFDKPAFTPCRHLTREQSCAVHPERVALGMSGCTLYDCHGAGPRATRAFASERGREREQLEAFMVLRVVFELLWLLTGAERLLPPAHAELRLQLTAEIERLDAIAYGPVAALALAELAPLERSARTLLRRVGAAIGGRRRCTVVR